LNVSRRWLKWHDEDPQDLDSEISLVISVEEAERTSALCRSDYLGLCHLFTYKENAKLKITIKPVKERLNAKGNIVGCSVECIRGNPFRKKSGGLLFAGEERIRRVKTPLTEYLVHERSVYRRVRRNFILCFSYELVGSRQSSKSGEWPSLRIQISKIDLKWEDHVKISSWFQGVEMISEFKKQYRESRRRKK